ncbi:methionine--tRNA ligase [Ralstonia pseudosolanacearum]|uniref:methionine--tRNA ligase n=1 Tax=Ralstonia pseudosolanacearum TaxID=1310165 RepID=UPI00190FF94D|nr:methionine--tRNA ligase [Ralstonia solanacearum]
MTRYIVTITPPTPNGDLHLGHLSGPFLAADICRRLLRQAGEDTILLSYSDDYQSYMPRKARQLRKETFGLARYNARQIELAMQAAEIDIDCFLQAADSDTFARFAGERFDDIGRLGLLELKATPVFRCDACAVYGYEGLGRGHCNWCGASSDASQCEACARVPDVAHMQGMHCILCGGDMHRVPVTRYVWKIGAQYPAIAEALKALPKRAALETYLADVLRNTSDAWPVTRPGDAGLELDGYPDQPVNTWFMGLAGYQAALADYLAAHPERGAFDDWWTPDTQLVHFLGYDCSYSHAVGYTAQLLARPDGPRPGVYLTNQFLKLDGQDFSTSRGHAVWIREITAQHPVDAIRLYTALCAPENETRDFDRAAFEAWRKAIFDGIVAAYTRDLSAGAAPSAAALPAQLEQRIAGIRGQWARATSLGAFSIAGLAKAALDMAQLTMTECEPGQRHLGWRIFSEMVASVAPSTAAEIDALMAAHGPNRAAPTPEVEIAGV